MAIKTAGLLNDRWILVADFLMELFSTCPLNTTAGFMKPSLSAYKNKVYPAVKHQKPPIQDFYFQGQGKSAHASQADIDGMMLKWKYRQSIRDTQKFPVDVCRHAEGLLLLGETLLSIYKEVSIVVFLWFAHPAGNGTAL